MKNNSEWTTVIKPKAGWFDINLKELWHYRDLIFMFLKRNFNSAYKQTVLGPLWFLISSNAAWGYFSACLSSTASTFTSNAYLFGKVYFPRLVSPVTTVIYGMLSFFIQMLLFTVCSVVLAARGQYIHPNIYMLYLPLMIAQMALLGLGVGIIISSVTTKYRDLTILIGFGLQLWMYATPVV